MTLPAFFSDPLWFQLGMTLVHFLWQAAAIALFIWGAVRLYELRHGAPRYNTYLLGLVLMMASPVITFSILHHIGDAFPGSATDKTHRIVFNAPSDTSYQNAGEPIALEVTVPQGSKPIPRWQRMILAGFASCQHGIHLSIPWFLAVWISGVFVLSLRLLLGYGQLCFWRCHACSLPEDLLVHCRQLAARFGFDCFHSIYGSHHVHEAMAMGIFRPAILLPATWITQMDPDMLEAIVAHELAHLRRYDLWINLVQRIVETIFFYHPAVWWLSKGLRREREYCCDQYATDVIAGHATYASALHRAGQLKLWATNTMAMGLGAHSDTLLSRVRVVLGMRGTETHRYHWLAGLACLVVMGLFVAPPALAWVQYHSDESRILDTGQTTVLTRLTQDSSLDPASLLAILESSRNGLESQPHDMGQLATYGIASYRLLRFKAAEESLTKVLQACPDHSPLRFQCLFFLAKTYRELDQEAEARVRFEACLHYDRLLQCLSEAQRSEALDSLSRYDEQDTIMVD